MTDTPKWTPPEYSISRWSEVIDILIACEEYFEKRADAEYFPDSPQPVGNEEMQLYSRIKELLG